MTDFLSLKNDIRRVVVLGHTGFIGQSLLTRLETAHPDVETIGLSLTDVNLTSASSSETLTRFLSPDTAVVLCAAIKRQLGDIPDIYMKNTAMVVNLINRLADSPVRRVVYLSSTAVYGEGIDVTDATEASPVDCRTYYGLSKYTAEWMLSKSINGRSDCSVGLVRIPTVYGPGDPGTTYGPSVFHNSAKAGHDITIVGDGTELREFMYIDDVAEMLTRYVFLDHSGPINLVSGTSYSFQDAVAAVAQAMGTSPAIKTKERNSDAVNNTFDNTLLRQLMPDLTFTSLEDGVRFMHSAG